MGPSSSRPTSPSDGPGYRPSRKRRRGRLGCRRFACSRPGGALPTDAQRSRRSGSSPDGIAARFRTSTATRRSRRSSGQPASSLRVLVCEGRTYATIFGLLAVDGHADQRSDGARSGGRGPARRGPADPADEVRQVAAAWRSMIRPASPRRLCPPQGPSRRRERATAFFLSESGDRITEWGTRYNFAQVSRKVGLRAPRWPPRPRATGSTTCAIDLPACTLVRVVSSRDRCRAGDSQAGHLPRPRARRRDLLVHRGRPGAAGARHRAAGARGRARCT